MYPVVSLALLTTLAALTQGQRITTIQLEGVQYFVSRMNPYSPELNWFLAYQYCRSIGLQLASFETKEKADYFMEYLRNAGYSKYDFWTSGNRLGTDMFLWMSTGLPFNVTFNYMKGDQDSDPLSSSLTHGPQPITRKKRGDSGASNGCVAMKKPELQWDTDDCTAVKDFICEQTRCYYYNYGSIPVSTAQGVPPTFSSSPYASPSTTSPTTGTPPFSVATRKIASPFTTPRREPTTSAYRTEAYPTTTEDHAAKMPEPVPKIPESVPRMPEEAPKMRDDEPHVPKVHEESQEYITTSDSSEDYNTHPEAEQTTAAIHEETNELHSVHLNMRDPGIGGSRGMPHELSETFSWPWARNIMLEKPVARKTSSTDE